MTKTKILRPGVGFKSDWERSAMLRLLAKSSADIGRAARYARRGVTADLQSPPSRPRRETAALKPAACRAEALAKAGSAGEGGRSALKKVATGQARAAVIRLATSHSAARRSAATPDRRAQRGRPTLADASASKAPVLPSRFLVRLPQAKHRPGRIQNDAERAHAHDFRHVLFDRKAPRNAACFVDAAMSLTKT